jgi:hypothetical protein
LIFLIVLFECRDLQDRSVALKVVNVLIFYTDEGPLSSAEALKQTLDKWDDLLVYVGVVEGDES